MLCSLNNEGLTLKHSLSALEPNQAGTAEEPGEPEGSEEDELDTAPYPGPGHQGGFYTLGKPMFPDA